MEKSYYNSLKLCTVNIFHVWWVNDERFYVTRMRTAVNLKDIERKPKDIDPGIGTE